MNMFLDLLYKCINGYEGEKQKLFYSHIEPLMNHISEFHNEYIQSFRYIKQSLEKKEIPTSELLDFLEERKHQRSAERNLTKELAKALTEAERRLVRKSTWDLFNNFSKAAFDYFIASNEIARHSWYTDFINLMKLFRDVEDREIKHEVFNSNIFGNDPRSDLILHLSKIIEKDLPAKLTEVNKYYAKLRGELL